MPIYWETMLIYEKELLSGDTEQAGIPYSF